MDREKKFIVSLLTNKDDVCQASRLSWQKIYKVCDYAKVSPLVFSCLKRRKTELRIPQEARLRMEDAYTVNLLRNTLIVEEVARLARILEKHQISIILLKGIYLLRTVYEEDIASRRMEDIDILVEHGTLEKAEGLLRDSGYTPKLDEWHSRPATLYFPDDPSSLTRAPVHLHTHIVNASYETIAEYWPQVDMGQLWARARALEVGGHTGCMLMAPEDGLLSLAEHAFRHSFSRMILLYDIHAFIEKYGNSLTWSALSHRAQEWGLTTPLYLSLELCRRLFATALAPDFLATLKPDGLRLWEKYFFKYALGSNCPREDACFFVYLAMNRTIRKKIQYVRSTVANRLQFA